MSSLFPVGYAQTPGIWAIIGASFVRRCETPMYRYLLGLLLLASSTATGNGLQVGQAPPDLTIADRGELLLEDDKFSYQPWQLPQALGKVLT